METDQTSSYGRKAIFTLASFAICGYILRDLATNQIPQIKSSIWPLASLGFLFSALLLAVFSGATYWLCQAKNRSLCFLFLTTPLLFSTNLGALLLSVAMIFSCAVIGRSILRASFCNPMLELFYSIATGYALLVGILSLTIRVQLPNHLVPISAIITSLYLIRSGTPIPFKLPALPTPTVRSTALLILLVFIGIIFTAAGSLPDISHDSNAVYYGFAKMISDGKPIPISPNWLSISPLNIGAIWPLLTTESISSPGGAKLFNLMLLVATCIGITGLCRKLLFTHNDTILTLCATLLTPILLCVTMNLHSEVGVTILLTASLSLPLALTIKKPPLVAMALLCGAAVSAKPQCLFGPGLFYLFIFLRSYFKRDALTSELIWSIIVFIVVGAFPYIASWAITGNPVYPLMNHVFKADGFPVTLFPAPYQGEWSLSLIPSLAIHTYKHMESGIFAFGLHHIIFGLPALLIIPFIKNYPLRLPIIFIGIFIVASFSGTQNARYIIPAIPILCLSYLSLIYSELNLMVIGVNKLIIYICLGVTLVFLPSANWQMRYVTVGALTKPTGRIQYQNTFMPERAIFSAINVMTRGEKCLILSASRPFSCGMLSNFAFGSWYDNSNSSNLLFSKNAFDIYTHMLKANISYIAAIDPISNYNLRPIQQFIDEYCDVAYAFDNGVKLYELTGSKNKNPTPIVELSSAFTRNSQWNVAGSPKFENNQITVTDKDFLTHLIDVKGRKSVTIELSASPVAPLDATIIRVQINWLGSNNKILRPDIYVVNLTDSAKISKKFRIPADCSHGIVFVNAHSSTPALFKMLQVK